MLAVPILFVLLVGWGLKEGEIYWPEALIWTVAFIGCCVGFVCFPTWIIPFIVALVLIVIVLIMRIFGTDILIH